jgi:hypothetical protein
MTKKIVSGGVKPGRVFGVREVNFPVRQGPNIREYPGIFREIPRKKTPQDPEKVGPRWPDIVEFEGPDSVRQGPDMARQGVRISGNIREYPGIFREYPGINSPPQGSGNPETGRVRDTRSGVPRSGNIWDTRVREYPGISGIPGSGKTAYGTSRVWDISRMGHLAYGTSRG